jgi:hypothetical protein
MDIVSRRSGIPIDFWGLGMVKPLPLSYVIDGFFVNSSIARLKHRWMVSILPIISSIYSYLIAIPVKRKPFKIALRSSFNLQ